jgi:chromosome segregation ATPase
MTGDELERAINFILKNQADHEAKAALADERLTRLSEQISQLSQQGAGFQQRLDSLADSQANLVNILTPTLEAQARINEQRRAADESLRAGEEALRAAMTKLAERQEQTEATVGRLSLKVEALAEQTAGTDRRLDALIKIVEEQRDGGQ